MLIFLASLLSVEDRFTQPCKISCLLVVLKGSAAYSQHSCVRLNPKLEKFWQFHSRGGLQLPSRLAILSCVGMGRSRVARLRKWRLLIRGNGRSRKCLR